MIRVVFQNQAMYLRTLFRGTKSCKFGGKKGVFLSFFFLFKFGKGHDGKMEEKTSKNA